MVLDDFSVRVQDLHMQFMEYTKDKFFSMGTNRLHKALNGISFELQKGERLAIIGRNGSGKSTLLRCISGFHRPQEGKITVKGRSLLLAGTDPGFDRNLTGRENVTEMAAAYGVEPRMREDFVNSIRLFTELGSDFDRKYGNYSTGMKGKLGFGFISHLMSDVLLVDETFSSGDMEFKRKAKQKMDELLANAGSVIMCTHSMSLASQICTRAIIMENGYIAFEGDITEGLEFYKNLNKKLVNWIDFDMAGLSFERGVIEVNLHEKFSIDEDLRLVIHDNSANTFIHFEVLSKGESFTLKLEDLPENPDCKVKLQQQRFGKWYDASSYIDIIPLV